MRSRSTSGRRAPWKIGGSCIFRRKDVLYYSTTLLVSPRIDLIERYTAVVNQQKAGIPVNVFVSIMLQRQDQADATSCDTAAMVPTGKQHTLLHPLYAQMRCLSETIIDVQQFRPGGIPMDSELSPLQ